jgi:hypothetical protein
LKKGDRGGFELGVDFFLNTLTTVHGTALAKLLIRQISIRHRLNVDNRFGFNIVNQIGARNPAPPWLHEKKAARRPSNPAQRGAILIRPAQQSRQKKA